MGHFVHDMFLLIWVCQEIRAIASCVGERAC
jgi:hypothetical protein